MIRIIYMDIDGTLRDEVHGITQRTADAVRRCRAQGIHMVVCTGRNPASIQPDVRQLPADGLIAGDGCYIRLGGKLLRRSCFPPQTVAAVLAAAARLGLGLSMEAEEQIFMNQSAALYYQTDFERKLAGSSAPALARQNNCIQYQDNLSALDPAKTPIHKICLIGNLVSALAKSLSGQAQTVQQRDAYLELVPPGCGKGSAVCLVNRALGIPRAESLCFGDGANDLDMFAAAGVRVAVQGGCPALIQQADSLCPPPAESGIAEELERRRILPCPPHP